MTEKLKMTRDIHKFVWRDMEWESAIDLIGKVSKSEKWIDYLLMEMDLYEHFKKRYR